MKTKWTFALLCLGLAAGCASEPTWDVSVFPPQPVYDGTPAAPTLTSTTAPAK